MERIGDPSFLPHLLKIVSHDVKESALFSLHPGVIARADDALRALIPFLTITELVRLRDETLARFQDVRGYWERNAQRLGLEESAAGHVKRVGGVAEEAQRAIDQRLEESRGERRILPAAHPARYASTHYRSTLFGFAGLLVNLLPDLFSLVRTSNVFNLLPRFVVGAVFMVGRGVFYDSWMTALGLLTVGRSGHNGADCGEGLANVLLSGLALRALAMRPAIRPFFQFLADRLPFNVRLPDLPPPDPVKVFLREVDPHLKELPPDVSGRVESVRNRHSSEVPAEELAALRREVEGLQQVGAKLKAAEEGRRREISGIRAELESLAEGNRRARMLHQQFLARIGADGFRPTAEVLGELRGLLRRARRAASEGQRSSGGRPSRKAWRTGRGERARPRATSSAASRASSPTEGGSAEQAVLPPANNGIGTASPLVRAVKGPPQEFSLDLLTELTGGKMMVRNGAMKALRDFYRDNADLRGAFWGAIQKIVRGNGGLVEGAKANKRVPGEFHLRVSIRYRLFFRMREQGGVELTGIQHRGKIPGWSER